MSRGVSVHSLVFQQEKQWSVQNMHDKEEEVKDEEGQLRRQDGQEMRRLEGIQTKKANERMLLLPFRFMHFSINSIDSESHFSSTWIQFTFQKWIILKMHSEIYA